jgi:hypothetical protein
MNPGQTLSQLDAIDAVFVEHVEALGTGTE